MIIGKGKKGKRLIAIATAWLMVVQLVLPPVLLAEELEASGSAEIMETGNAAALSVAVTEVNTTSIGSTTETKVINIGEETGDVLPFELEEEAGEGTASAEKIDEIGVEVTNEATVAAETSATAETGNNTQESSGSATMQTGDAVAVANSLTLVNTTLANSELQVGIINVLSDWDGDLILDPYEDGELSWGTGIGKIAIDSSGNVVVTTTAEATTGGNSQAGTGEAILTTGAAAALASSLVVTGMTLVNAEVLQFLVQNLWLWTGTIYNWEYPGSVTAPSSLAGDSSASSTCTDNCVTSLSVNNQADVTVTTTASANTGNNTQVSSGSATMQTGNALASATSTTLVNTTLINSRLTLLQMLLFGEWSGDLIFAYPDLVVTVSAPSEIEEGEEIVYTIAVGNAGYKKATGIDYNYLITNDEHEVGQDEQQADQLLPGETLSWEVSFPTEGRGGHLVTLQAEVTGENTEITTNNNQARVQTIVVNPAESAVADVQQDQPSQKGSAGEVEVPTLALSGGNNATLGVYPGDGIRYDWRAQNLGPITAHKVVFVQEFYTPGGLKLAQAGGPVGEIALNKSKSISLVMTPSPTLPPGDYYTLSYLTGESDQGAKTKSNTVRGEVKLLGRTLIAGAKAGTSDETTAGGAILGKQAPPAACTECVAYPWYAGVLAGSLVYYLTNRRRQDYGRVLRWGLAIPLTGYAGLLVTSGDCRQGLVLAESLGAWCQYFLPAAYGLYGGIGLGVGLWKSRFNWQRNLSTGRL